MSKQAISGVAPGDFGEVTITTVWPSVAATRLGRMLGELYQIRFGVGSVFTVGRFIALCSIPLALALYFYNLLIVGRRYRLTNRRVVVEKGLRARSERSVSLDDFDSIDVVVLPGQPWYPAGDLLFRKGQVETFSIAGVRWPEAFRQTCLKAQRAHAGVKQALSARRTAAARS